jgi:phage baseplate assembly protein gpV
MTGTDSTKRPDAEVVTAIVVDGMLAAGDVADAPVPWWSFTKTVLAAAALVLVDAGRLTLDAPLAGRRYTLCQLLQAVAFAPVHDQGLVEQRVVEIARGIAGGERE